MIKTMEKVNKNFGYLNGYSETPKEILQAYREGYDFEETEIGRCQTRYECKELGIIYKVDSSD